MQQVIIMPCPAARQQELFALRARVWIAEGADPSAFPLDSWSDPHDALRLHWIAVDGDRIVGGAALAMHETLDSVEEADAYLPYLGRIEGAVAAPARVVVDPAYRGVGLAQRLLDVQDDAAREANARISVRQASPAMRRLLERRGWTFHGPAPRDARFPLTEFSVMSFSFAGQAEDGSGAC
jgi:GNAT superfamily N-acetyltransferase